MEVSLAILGQLIKEVTTDATTVNAVYLAVTLIWRFGDFSSVHQI